MNQRITELFEWRRGIRGTSPTEENELYKLLREALKHYARFATTGSAEDPWALPIKGLQDSAEVYFHDFWMNTLRLKAWPPSLDGYVTIQYIQASFDNHLNKIRKRVKQAKMAAEQIRTDRGHKRMFPAKRNDANITAVANGLIDLANVRRVDFPSESLFDDSDSQSSRVSQSDSEFANLVQGPPEYGVDVSSAKKRHYASAAELWLGKQAPWVSEMIRVALAPSILDHQEIPTVQDIASQLGLTPAAITLRKQRLGIRSVNNDGTLRKTSLTKQSPTLLEVWITQFCELEFPPDNTHSRLALYELCLASIRHTDKTP